MAVVYRAEDTSLHREVAVKVLHPHLAGQPESRARLQREAQAVAKLRHENILEIFDYSGSDSPDSYIVTEFIHGQTLKSFLLAHPLPFPEVAELIASEVARALEHAHRLGVIHRDVKPENVMIRDDGLIKLTDFGIAQIVDRERMTVTGQLLGSPAYMAPEHVEGRPLDFRTDVFALGVLIYQLACGELPFSGKNPHEVLKKIAECRFTPPDAVNPLVGQRLKRLIEKALARDPDQRFAAVGLLRRELVEDLSEAGLDDPRGELGRFFADPSGWARTTTPRLVAALTARGKVRVEEGRTAAALDLWGRALGHDPHSAELRDLIEQLAVHRRRGRRLLVAGGALAAVVALGAGAARWLGPKKSQETKPPPVSRAAAHPPSPAPPPVSPPVAPPSPRPSVAPTRPARHRKSAPPPRRFELAPTPKAVTIFLDGERLGDYGPALQSLLLAPGRHVVRFESPYCFPKEVVVDGSDPARRVAARLRWKPARLTVKTEPESADVLVDGSILRSGQSIDVNVPELSEGKKLVSLQVSAPGYQSRQLELELRANDQRLQVVHLAPSGAP